MRIVFARTAWHYDSYRIFWRLVDLSGFEQVPLGQVDLASEAFYIVSPPNGELSPEMTEAEKRLGGRQRRARTAVWNLERPDTTPGVSVPDRATAATEVDRFLASVDHVWAFDPYYASFDERLVRVTIGGHPGLREGAPGPKAWDLCHFSYVNGRREAVLSALRARHTVAPETWGPDRAQILNGSRSMAYIHQTPFPIGSPLRFALAGAYELPLMAEHMENPYPMEPGWDFQPAQYNGFADAFSEWLPGADPAMGRRLHKRLCVDFTFRKCVEDGVRRSLLWA